MEVADFQGQRLLLLLLVLLLLQLLLSPQMEKLMRHRASEFLCREVSVLLLLLYPSFLLLPLDQPVGCP